MDFGTENVGDADAGVGPPRVQLGPERPAPGPAERAEGKAAAGRNGERARQRRRGRGLRRRRRRPAGRGPQLHGGGAARGQLPRTEDPGPRHDHAQREVHPRQRPPR